MAIYDLSVSHTLGLEGTPSRVFSFNITHGLGMSGPLIKGVPTSAASNLGLSGVALMVNAGLILESFLGIAHSVTRTVTAARALVSLLGLGHTVSVYKLPYVETDFIDASATFEIDVISQTWVTLHFGEWSLLTMAEWQALEME
jgi:hypothetical protein